MLTTAVHEAVAIASLGFTLKKEQEKVIVAFMQGHDVFVALLTGFGKNHCYSQSVLLSVLRLRGFTNRSIAVVYSESS